MSTARPNEGARSLASVHSLAVPGLSAVTAAQWLEKADREGDLAQAREDYRKAAEKDPRGPSGARAWLELGKLEFTAPA